MRSPRVFGQWGSVSTPGEAIDEWATSLDRQPRQRAARVAMWLRSRGIHSLSPEVEAVLGWCESGAEAITAAMFPRADLPTAAVGDRALRCGDELLELQVEIPETRFRADFRWTTPTGFALIEVWGAGAHGARRDADRVRHEILSRLGYTVHYVPAELAMRLPSAIWPAIRRRQLRARREAIRGA